MAVPTTASPAMNTAPETSPAYIPIDPRSPDPDFRPGAVWTQARADYLAGESAPRVCQRYELALSTFRTRMRVEGWRRCDQKDEVEPRELDPAPPTLELVDQAWRAMADALKRGRAYEARTFLRLVHDLRAEVSREEAIVQHRAWKAAQAGTLDPDLHGLHSGLDSAADAQLAEPSPSITLHGLVPGIHPPGGQLRKPQGMDPKDEPWGGEICKVRLHPTSICTACTPDRTVQPAFRRARKIALRRRASRYFRAAPALAMVTGTGV
jgi:hypothetical protein